MAMLPGPQELFDLPNGEKASFRATRFEEGQLEIRPVSQPEGKVVDALRVHVEPADKPFGMPYWDITSKTLRAQLIPWLRNPATARRRFTVTASGFKPRKRFSLEVV